MLIKGIGAAIAVIFSNFSITSVLVHLLISQLQLLQLPLLGSLDEFLILVLGALQNYDYWLTRIALVDPIGQDSFQDTWNNPLIATQTQLV